MKILLMLLVLALVACSDTRHGVPVTGVILQVVKDSALFGCPKDTEKTTIKLDDGRLAQVCGNWGPVGTKVKGMWYTGSEDETMNGFSFQ